MIRNVHGPVTLGDDLAARFFGCAQRSDGLSKGSGQVGEATTVGEQIPQRVKAKHWWGGGGVEKVEDIDGCSGIWLFCGYNGICFFLVLLISFFDE